MTVDIGQNNDWLISDFKEVQSTTIEGEKYVEEITKQYYNDSKDHNNIQIPAQKDESDYTLDTLSEQQQAVVLASINAIMKFLNNDTKYKPLQAIVMGCGGTGKSFIMNTIIFIVQKVMQQNETIQVGAPTGAAAFNVHESTLHHLLGIDMSQPEESLQETTREQLK